MILLRILEWIGAVRIFDWLAAPADPWDDVDPPSASALPVLQHRPRAIVAHLVGEAPAPASCPPPATPPARHEDLSPILRWETSSPSPARHGAGRLDPWDDVDPRDRESPLFAAILASWQVNA